jgi:membrane protease YdiL (CAAX protease family)
MKSDLGIPNVKTLIHPGELKPTVILLSAAVFLSIDRHFGSADFWVQNGFIHGGLAATWLMFFSAFIMMFLLPVVLVRFLFHEDLRNYGLRLGDWRTGLRSTVVLIPLISVLLLLPAARTSEMKAFYPLTNEANTVAGFFLLQTPRVLFFYVAWEFFFRGFMLFGLRPIVGDWVAICIQTVPSCLWHIGLPTGELLSSIAAGIMFGMMAIKTSSIVWPILLHALIGNILDLMILWGA